MHVPRKHISRRAAFVLAALGLAAAPAGASVTLFPSGTTTNGVTTAYSTTAGTYSFLDPVGINSIQVSLFGAGGGGLGGSFGSYLTGLLSVTPGSTYSIVVGGGGGAGVGGGGAGGSPGAGGAGKPSPIFGGGGGGGGGFSSIASSSPGITLAEAPGGAGGPGLGSDFQLDPALAGTGGGKFITTGLTSPSETDYPLDPTYHLPAGFTGTDGEVALVYGPRSLSAAPEPSEFAALGFVGLGLGGLLLRARRRAA